MMLTAFTSGMKRFSQNSSVSWRLHIRVPSKILEKGLLVIDTQLAPKCGPRAIRKVQDELGLYTKEAEECFRCIAGADAKSPCPEVRTSACLLQAAAEKCEVKQDLAFTHTHTQKQNKEISQTQEIDLLGKENLL